MSGMMGVNRETLYAAVFNLLKNSASFKTASRKLRHWSEVPPEEQPALFVVQGGEVPQVTTKTPTVWSLKVSVYIYAHTAAGMREEEAPSQILNPLVDAVTDAIELPSQPFEQTLGGLCHRLRLDGAIETDEGVLGDQGVVIIPITIVV